MWVPSMAETGTPSDIEYDIEDRPPLGESIPLGLQHVFAMFLGNVAPPLIVAGGIGMATGETTFLVQMALIVAGIATIVQVSPIGPVGARLPIVMGTSFAFLGPMIGIGNSFGISAIFGAALVASPVEVIAGFSLQRFRKYFPPLVTGVVVMLIGLTLIPTGVDYAAGGVGAADYASFANLGLAALVFLVTIILNQFFEGIWRIASVFIGIVVGYVVAIPLGMVDFSAVAQAGWFTVPIPLKYGLSFHPSAIATIAFMYVITSMETIGDISGIVAATNRTPTREQLRGGLVADGVMSAFAAIFNAMPNTSFSQNVGLVNFTGVASRYVAGVAGVILVILGFIPKIGAFVSAMPDAVLGGGAIILFAMIFGSGFKLIKQHVDFNHRNNTILSISVALGLMVQFRPEILQNLPSTWQNFFGSALIVGGFAALLLNILVPGGGVGTGPTELSDGLDEETASGLDMDFEQTSD